MRRNTVPFLLVLIAIIFISLPCSAQNTFPRDGNESLALRIHDSYRQSQSLLTRLEADRIKVQGFITEVAPGSTMVGTAVAPEDVALLKQINQNIVNEQEWCRQLEVFWERNRAEPAGPARSFAGRYGTLSKSDQRSTNPKYDQIEYAIRTFPFNVTPPPPATNRGTSPFAGLWHTHRVHSGCCSYAADDDLAISTDANGNTTSSSPSGVFPGEGKVTGNTYTFSYGPGNTGSFTLSDDGRSFTGTFSDSNNHHGTVQGRR